MKADRNEAPEWIRSDTRRKGTLGMLIPGAIGLVVTLGALNIAGQAFMQNTVQNLADRKQQPKPVPVAEITRSEPPRKDWDRVVEEKTRREAISQPQLPQPQPTTESSSSKQTVFNDQNYTPRGADNVLSFRETYQPVEPEKPAGKVRVTVIKQEQKLKDWACWGKEGSIVHRNCRLGVGLNYRD